MRHNQVNFKSGPCATVSLFMRWPSMDRVWSVDSYYHSQNLFSCKHLDVSNVVHRVKFQNAHERIPYIGFTGFFNGKSSILIVSFMSSPKLNG